MSAPADIREDLAQMPLERRFERSRRWRDRTGDDIAQRATRQALRELALRIGLLDEQADRMEAELAVHNPQRIATEAFAHLCGVAPIPASSGKTNRHRFNRGGDRSANHALWRIAMVRRVHD